MDIVGFLNQKGGAGKTTSTANFGAVLGKQGYRVLLLDLDPQAGLTKTLRIPTRWNLFESGITPVQTQLPNVQLVPGGPNLVKTEMAFTQQEKYDLLRPLISGIRGYDFVLVDCPPNLYGLTGNALVAVDRILLPFPLTPGVIYSMSDTFDLIHELREKGFPVTHRIDGLITIYRKMAAGDKLVSLARKFIPNVLNTRIRQSNHYVRAEALGTAAALIAGNAGFPLVDHRNALKEMGLLQAAQAGAVTEVAA